MAGSNVVNAVGPTYHLSDVKAAAQSAINCYPRRLDGQKWILDNTEGTVDIASFSECRGSKYVDGRWFVVAGSTLYEMQTDGTSVSHGTLVTASGPVSMAESNDFLAIVDGENLYKFNLSNSTFAHDESEGWRGSKRVDEVDGYFVFADPGTDQFYIVSSALTGVFDPLDFSSADATPGKILAHIVSNHQLFIYKTKSREIWVDSGGADFPFTRYNSFPSEVGCVGPHAVVSAAGTVYLVGATERGTAIVYEDSGTRPTPISNSAIEQILRTCTDLSKIEMMAYQPEGAEFIVIRGPGMKTCPVYDAKSKLWHERAEWVSGDWDSLDWSFVTAVGKEHYGGDINGKVFRLDKNVNQYSGRQLVRERTWPHLVSPMLEPTSYRGLEISAKTGATTPGVITLQISNDGGNNFGPPLLRSLGAAGRFMERIRWLGLGSAINRVFRIRCSDNVPFAIYSASVDA
jgi:hypothetical protein